MSPTWAIVRVQGWTPWGFCCDSSVTPTPHPSLGLSFPKCRVWGSSAPPEWRETPPCGQLGPSSPGGCAGTSQVRCSTPPRGNRLPPALHAPGGAHTLIDTAPGLREGAEGGGGSASEEVGFGKPSLNQLGTKASSGWLPSPGRQRARREDESPGIVRQLCPGLQGEGLREALTRPR